MAGFQHRARDVCVIGGGLAGLIAADTLIAHGLSVDLFEAQSGVGGRIRDAQLPGRLNVELGANWFSRRQMLIAEQIRRFDLETVVTNDLGSHLFVWDGRIRRFTGGIPPLGMLSLLDISRALAKFDGLARRLAGSDPWARPDLSRYDQRSFGQWIDSNLFTRHGKEFFHLVSEMVFGVESYLVSLLYVLYYANRSDSLTSLIAVTGGHQELRFKNGPGALCEAIAAGMRPAIHLDCPVQSVRIEKSSALVETAHGKSRYRAVLCAVSPAAIKRIFFTPALPAGRDRLLQSLPMGRVIKVQAIFDSPVWLDHGLSGQVMSNGEPLTYLIDNSPPDRSRGILAGFICSSRADRFLATADREQRIADSIVAIFEGRVPRPKQVLIEDWAANPWIGGSYGAYFPPGVMTRFGAALHAAHPPLYWCGAEHGLTHPCQMEGALESGQRVASSIVQSLGRKRSDISTPSAVQERDDAKANLV